MVVATLDRIIIKALELEDVSNFVVLCNSGGITDFNLGSYNNMDEHKATDWIKKELEKYPLNGIGKNIQLKQFSIDQAGPFYNSIHDEIDPSDDYRVRLQEKYSTLDKVEARIIDAVDNKFKVDETPDFFIYYKSELAGIFEFAPLEKNKKFVEVGYWLYRKYRRKGILSAIFPEMIAYAKSNFSKRERLIATTPLDNIPSQKLLEKIGFQNTGKVHEFKKEHGIVEKDIEYEVKF